MYVRAGFLVLALVACFLSLSAAAGADPVNEVNVQIKDIRPGGSYTLVFTANQYDTSGAQPPQVRSNTLRLASGVTIRPQFLGSRYRCDVPRMRDIIIENPERSPVRSERFAHLGATLKRIRGDLTVEEAAVVERCAGAQIGQGTVVADTRPYIDDPVPAKLTLYLSKPMAKGAIASIGVVAVIDESSKPYRENPKRVVRLLGPPVFYANVFNDPTPDGRYGYRIALPTPPTNLVLGVKISLAEVKVTFGCHRGRDLRAPSKSRCVEATPSAQLRPRAKPASTARQACWRRRRLDRASEHR